MYNSKLIKLYQSLNKEELFNFRKWLTSSPKKHHPDTIKLFKYLWTRQKITKLTSQKERIHKHLYPNKKINIARLRHIMSFATTSLEQFIKQKHLLSDNLLAQKTLTKAYKQRNLKKYALQHLDKAQDELNSRSERNANYYLNHYELELEKFELSMAGARPTSTNLQEIINGFYTFFVINLLRYACTSISHQNIYKTTYDLPLLESVLLEIKTGKYKENPAIQLYYYCYLSLSQKDNLEHFEQLKIYMQEYHQVLNKEEYKELYTLAINYCIKQQNSGNAQFIQEAFDWYKKGIDKSILLDKQGELSRFTYLNTITLGLKLKEFDWVESFIKTGAKYLATEYQESYQHYNMAKFYFAKKEYAKAMPLFIRENYKDLFMNIDIRVMQLKIYYEEQSWEALESLISSFTVFLQRKSVMSYHKKNYLNLIHFVRKLIEASDEDSLIEAIKTTTPLTEQKWLMEQVQKK